MALDPTPTPGVLTYVEYYIDPVDPAQSTITFYGQGLNWLGQDGSLYTWPEYLTVNDEIVIKDYSQGATNIVAADGTYIKFGPTSEYDFCDPGASMRVCNLELTSCTNAIVCVNVSYSPTTEPTLEPTVEPTVEPSSTPSYYPSFPPSRTPGVLLYATYFYDTVNVAKSTITFFGVHLNWLGQNGSLYTWFDIAVVDGENITNNYSIGANVSVAPDGSYIAFGPSPYHDYCDVGHRIQVCSVDGSSCTNKIVCTAPSEIPTLSPTPIPSLVPSRAPSEIPSLSPSSNFPTLVPSTAPRFRPTLRPSFTPSISPTRRPSFVPSTAPSTIPGESQASATSTTTLSTAGKVGVIVGVIGGVLILVVCYCVGRTPGTKSGTSSGAPIVVTADMEGRSEFEMPSAAPMSKGEANESHPTQKTAY